MKSCECGCGEYTAGGKFRPGHDQKLRSRLEAKTGDLLGMRNLVESAFAYSQGQMSESDFLSHVRSVFAQQHTPR
ncbi:hypothetical protein Fbal_0413 [Ferrimonas balearica DSM 9799]|uniref:Uncharacterized protein n=1 Tax=Ferrimonas balearica (strain DSM 9799 / CCM 4581 / KCTC 23876 / PAT) TaxID=550540 RepID=E1SNC8_FERBD|nr:hypothetical protein Fbal_0413 [Ferrimonas balearica DSM 9799]